MAQPTTEVQQFRNDVTNLIKDLRKINAILAVVEDHGTTDAERQAFFSTVFASSDITWAEFAQGVVALRAIQTAWSNNKIALAKLLI